MKLFLKNGICATWSQADDVTVEGDVLTVKDTDGRVIAQANMTEVVMWFWDDAAPALGPIFEGNTP